MASTRRSCSELLQSVEDEGSIERGRGRRLAAPGALPEVAVVEIGGTDLDGEVIGVPAVWTAETPAPRIYMAPERPGTPGLTAGMKVLARLRRLDGDSYEGRTIRVLAEAPVSIVGVYGRDADGREVIRPTNRRERDIFLVPPDAGGGAVQGELVLAEPLANRRSGCDRRAFCAGLDRQPIPAASASCRS